MLDPDLPPPTGPPLLVPTSTAPIVDRRPWWGMGDIVLGVPFIIVAAVLGTVVGVPFTDFDELESAADDGTLPTALIALGLAGQQIGQFAWPAIVARWKGFGAARDFGLRFRWIDLPLGLGTGAVMFGVGALLSYVLIDVAGLSSEEEADNSEILTDAEGSPWFVLLLLAVVVGAPLAEELFFRGLTLRAIEKRAGSIVAVLGSTLLFTLPHYTGASLQGTAVLFTVIFAVGLLLGLVTIWIGRLGPAIVAHMLFNGVSAAVAVGIEGLIVV